MKHFVFAALLILAPLAVPFPAFADDVTDQIEEALKAYKKNDLGMASTALNAALAFIRQARADGLAKLLPGAAPGWKIKEQDSSSGGAAMFGGGISASKRYVKGKMSVKISLMTDSPMLQAMSMMFTNPQMAGRDSRLVVISGQKVIHNKKKNSYQLMVAGKVLVSVVGNNKTEEKSVKEYFQAINFDAIAKYAQ